MNWPGLLITAPFATVRRNLLCQVFKARDRAAALHTEQKSFIEVTTTKALLLVNTVASAPQLLSIPRYCYDNNNIIESDDKR